MTLIQNTKYCIITDDLYSNRIQQFVISLAEITQEKIITVAYPKYKATQACSIKITVEKPVEFEIEKENKNGFIIQHVKYKANPCDAFILLHNKCNYFIFGPNDTTHSGFGNFVSSTVGMLIAAKYFQKKAASISMNKNAPLEFNDVIIRILDKINENYLSWNIFNASGVYAKAKKVNRTYIDEFENIKVVNRNTDNKFWLTYKPKKDYKFEDDTDAYFESKKINFIVNLQEYWKNE